MGLQFSWQEPLADETRRHRQHQVARRNNALRAAKLTLVPPAAQEIPTVIPGDYSRDHDVPVPSRKPVELALLGLLAIGLHAAVAWVLLQLPPAEILAAPKATPVEVVFAAPPPPPPPPKVEPPKPKIVQKAPKPTAVPVVQHPVPTEVAQTENVVAVEQGPPPAPVEEAVTAARADAGYLNNPPPQYPPQALRQGLQGTVYLKVLVQPDGHPARVTLEKTSGKKALDDAALAAVQNWRFVPAKRGETPIEGWVSFPIEFNLES